MCCCLVSSPFSVWFVNMVDSLYYLSHQNLTTYRKINQYLVGWYYINTGQYNLYKWIVMNLHLFASYMFNMETPIQSWMFCLPWYYPFLHLQYSGSIVVYFCLTKSGCTFLRTLMKVRWLKNVLSFVLFTKHVNKKHLYFPFI